MRYRNQLKAKKHPAEALSKLPNDEGLPYQCTAKTAKKSFDSNDSTPERHISKAILISSQFSVPEWFYNFCGVCSELNGWREHCPKLSDECILNRILDAAGEPDKLTDLELYNGITAEQVIDKWISDGESIHDLFVLPLWFHLVAESFDSEEE